MTREQLDALEAWIDAKIDVKTTDSTSGYFDAVREYRDAREKLERLFQCEK
jgi:hypothetical protein